jgi:small subunit ribosomal protein S1
MSELTKNNNHISTKDYEALLDKYKFKASELVPGKLIKGKVLKITPSFVLVDIGSKSEGIIPVEDFSDPENIKKINPGDEIEAILERTTPRDGYLPLSKSKAIAAKAMDNLEKAYKYNNWIIGKVSEKVNKGYLVDVGIKTFLPDSHADIKSIKDPNEIIGKRFKFKVIKFDRKSENAVVSRKLLLIDKKEKKKKQVFSQLKKGKTFMGEVKTLTNFGAFIDLGGVEGLLHISDMSWGKVNHPSDLFKIGEKIEVVILDYDEKEEKISLGYKQLTKDPWEDIEDKYEEGQKVKGKVVNLTDFGAFIELEKGVEGLIHVSDLTWSRKMVHPKKVLSPGEEVTVSILDVDPAEKRISLGLKQIKPHPLETLKNKYGPGKKVKGKITNITAFGAFMEVEKGVEGLIHISDISWKKINHPSDVLKTGDEIEAIILSIDVEKEKLSLGIKQLEGDIWEDFFERQKVGSIVNVKIVRIVDFGVFVEIMPGIEGVVFVSELSEKKIENPSDAFSVGEERLAKILKMNKKDKKIALSFKKAQLEMQRREYKKYMQSQDTKHTLGDIMKDQLKNIETPKIKSKKEKDNKS